MDIEKLKDLRERVRNTSGRLDDVILGHLICAINDAPFGHVSIILGVDFKVWSEFSICLWDGRRNAAPDVSLDAAVALVERRLPGEAWIVERDHHGKFHGILWVGDKARSVEHSTAPLAMLLALLNILIMRIEE